MLDQWTVPKVDASASVPGQDALQVQVLPLLHLNSTVAPEHSTEVLLSSWNILMFKIYYKENFTSLIKCSFS